MRSVDQRVMSIFEQNTISREELLLCLNILFEEDDNEMSHIMADDLLIKFINDAQIKQAFDDLHKWYA